MSSNSPPSSTDINSGALATTSSTAQVISMPTGTTITGLTMVSQPQMVVHSQSGPATSSKSYLDDSDPSKKSNIITPLKIPAVPHKPTPPRPSGGNVSYRAAPPIPQTRPSTIVTVPKPAQVNLAVAQQQSGNKMAVFQAPPGTQKFITTGQATAIQAQVSASQPTPPRLATATTVIRTPQFPMTIRAPASSPTMASIRLTTTAPASSSMQFVPVSIATLPLRQTGPVAVRPAPLGFRPSGGTIMRQPMPDTTISPVRVTLMQQAGGVKVGQTLASPASQAGFYKPVSITPQNPPTCMTPLSGSTMPSPRLAVVPASLSNQNLTVTMTTPTSQYNVPIAAHNLLTTRPQQHQQHARLPGNVAVPMVSTGGVTIQKATSAGHSGPGGVTRTTIALPYGTTSTIVTTAQLQQASSLATSGKFIASSTTTTSTLSAIPVARVCPQPLAAAVSTNSLVTLSSSGTTQQEGAGAFATRTTTGLLQQQQMSAINLSTSANRTQFHHVPTSTANIGNMIRPNMPVSLNMPKINLPTQTRLINFQGQQPFESQHPDHRGLPTNSPRPSILRRREGERELVMPGSPSSPPPRPDSASSSSSGSTTLSATSSPGGNAGNLSGCEDNNTEMKSNSMGNVPDQIFVNEPSPRKKPRKQQLARVREHPWSESEDSFSASINEQLRRKIPQQPPPQPPQQPIKEENESSYIRDKPRALLMADFRPSWKPRHNHFVRHTDVKPKDERRPTVNDLSNEKNVLQKVNGWKVYHLTSQMEDIIDIEAELTHRLSDLQKRLEKSAHPDIVGKEVAKTQELIKANLQRSKIIQDQMREAKDNAVEIFEHKSKIISIIHKYESKRHAKKRTADRSK